MKKYYEIRLSSIGIAICMVIFGLFLTIFPETSGKIFTRVFAAAVLLFALLHVWKWTRARKYEVNGTGYLIVAVLLLILSGIGFFMPEIILSFLPFVTGALLILDGIVKIPLVKEMWDWGPRMKWYAVLSVVVPLLMGICLAVNPFQAAAVMIRVFGIFLLIDGISDLIRSSMMKGEY